MFMNPRVLVLDRNSWAADFSATANQLMVFYFHLHTGYAILYKF